MNTFINIKTGNRFPANGCFGTFSVDKPKPEHFIRPGYPECTNGWKRFKPTEWRQEEIPDLAKPFTREQFREYAAQYGVTCAQEFLDSCDYCKPRAAYQMIHPPRNEELWNAEAAWFKATFEKDLMAFVDPLLLEMGNVYSMDILKFEKWLASWHGYQMHQPGSIKDFMTVKFGQENTERFVKLLGEAAIPSGERQDQIESTEEAVQDAGIESMDSDEIAACFGGTHDKP